MRSRLYLVSTILAALLLAVLLALVCFSSATPSQDALKEYGAIYKEMKESHIKRKSNQEKEVVRHTRKVVTKQAFLMQGSSRMEMQIQGMQSEVGIFTRKSNARVTETYDDAKGFIQEELYYVLNDGSEVAIENDGSLKRKIDNTEEPIPLDELKPMQLFRYFEADTAIYDFHSNTIIAYNVRFWTYKTEGHALIKNIEGLVPLSSGSARSFTSQYGNASSKPQFSAENLIMELNPA